MKSEIVIWIGIGIVFHFFMYRFNKRINSLPDAEGQKGSKSKFQDIDLQNWVNWALHTYGQKASEKIAVCGPLHSKIVQIAVQYERIVFDEYTMIFNRQWMQEAFYENHAFVKIGIWEDGSEVLVRRCAEDERIYIFWLEDNDSMIPKILAENFGEYLYMAWQLLNNRE